MQIAPSHKHSIGIFEAQKINFAKHNEDHKNLPHACKKKQKKTCNRIENDDFLVCALDPLVRSTFKDSTKLSNHFSEH